MLFPAKTQNCLADHLNLQMIQARHTHTLEEVGKIQGFDPERLREIARVFADVCQQATYQFVQYDIDLTSHA